MGREGSRIRRRIDLAKRARAIAWVAVDAGVVAASYYLATYIRFVDAGANPSATWERLPFLLGPMVVVYLVGNQVWSLNKRIWRYASALEVLMILTSVGLSTVLLLGVDLVGGLFTHARLLSVGIVVMGGFFTATGMTIVRYRWRIVSALLSRRPGNEAARTLVYGAGDFGRFVADRMMARPEDYEYDLIGFVDDDQGKHGQQILGLSVLGGGDDLALLIAKHRVNVIVLAISNATPEQRQRILDICTGTSALVVAPNFFDPVGSPAVPLVRETRVSDLLGRTEAVVDRSACSRVLEGRVVLVTGAAGSVGSELCRQVSEFKPRLLIGLDNNESGLYDLAIELRSGPSPVDLEVVVADVRNARAISRAFERLRPQVIFHAAAYKHVPLMETFPEEAVSVNVQGTDVVLEAARNVRAERFVLVSTDKAVKPSSLMGATKMVAELLVTSTLHPGSMLSTAVRFGNVFGTRGSVVPTFARQIQRGGPVTVTHPEMTRFFMEISEAAILIIQAAAMTRGNDLFMLEMGEPVKIDDLARRMIRMRGLRPDVDIKIVYTGVRPGEKLHEELVLDGEARQPTEHPMIHRIENRGVIRDHLELARLYELANEHRTGALVAALMDLCKDAERASKHGSPTTADEGSGLQATLVTAPKGNLSDI